MTSNNPPDHKAISALRIERPQNLRELVQDAMREAILDLRFAPGERLVERTLCAQLGVSRTVVREVLRFLEAEGLVEITPTGPAVTRIKPEEAEQIYEIRMLLEGMAAAACAEHATRADLKILKQAIDDLGTARDTGDARLSMKATARFYQHVFAVSQKTVAWKVVESLYVRINTLRAMTIRLSNRPTISVGEMKRIYAAIAAGDPEAARAAAVAHVQEASAAAQRTFAELEAAAAEDRPLTKENLS